MKNSNESISEGWMRRLPAVLDDAEHGDFLKEYKWLPGAVVTVKGTKAAGTGFHLGNGEFVTHAHVVGSDHDVEVFTSAGGWIGAYVEAMDIEEDIALVSTPNSEPYMFMPRLYLNLTPPQIHERVYLLGSMADDPESCARSSRVCSRSMPPSMPETEPGQS